MILIDVSKLVIKYYLYDAYRYAKHRINKSRKSSIEGVLLSTTHAIEKGLTMPDVRIGFGVDKIVLLVELLIPYIRKYGQNDCSRYSIGVIKEYVDFHESRHFAFNAKVLNAIGQVNEYFSNSNQCSTTRVTKADFFRGNKYGYKELVESRRSLRDFSSEEVDSSIIRDAVDLAVECPSACNRQPYRVYVISKRERIDDVLSIQQGNIGFGHLANKLLIVTSDISVFGGGKERHEVFINGGIFLNSLVNSLYYYSIGSCILNWSVEPRRDLALRKQIAIPEWENVIAIVAIGIPKESVGIAQSKKLKSQRILTFV